ncbi:MAG TPA: hypothetical protein VI968_03335 [archaeon]|nr:hypothetical protein [archaeon]
MDNERKIIFLQKQIDKIKHMHSIGGMNTKDAKRQISSMEKTIDDLLADIPQHKRELYSIKREFGM